LVGGKGWGGEEPVMLGKLGSINTSKGADVTVVKYAAVNLRTRPCCTQPATTSWLNVTVPDAAALAECDVRDALKTRINWSTNRRGTARRMRMLKRRAAPERMAALFANFKLHWLPGAICSRLTVTVVVEGGATIYSSIQYRFHNIISQ
jgi:hypothetical protein